MSNEQIVIPKGKVFSKLEVLNPDFDISSIDDNMKQASENTCSGQKFLQNVQISDCHGNEDMDTKFLSYFEIPDNLTTTEKIKLKQCLQSHKDLFVTEENPDLGFTEVVQHKISLKPDYRPKYHKPYRLPPDKKEALREHLDELLRQNIIAPVNESESVPITSPIVLVSKRNKAKKNSENQQDSYLSQYRFCCDFRYLNSQINDFCYNIPDLQDLTESFSHKTPNYLTSIDLSSGFFQLPIHSDSQRYTAFNTCFGTFKFLRLPMGLSSSPSSFQLLMDKVLHGLTFKICLCYLDDILITSETFDEHIEDINNVFQRLRDAGLKLGPKKCTFARDSCIFLGHLISKNGVQPPPDRITAIQNFPAPQSLR